MQTLADLIATQEFQTAGYDDRNDMYAVWKRDSLPELSYDKSPEYLSALGAEIDTQFAQYNPKLESAPVTDTLRDLITGGANMLRGLNNTNEWLSSISPLGLTINTLTPDAVSEFREDVAKSINLGLAETARDAQVGASPARQDLQRRRQLAKEGDPDGFIRSSGEVGDFLQVTEFLVDNPEAIVSDLVQQAPQLVPAVGAAGLTAKVAQASGLGAREAMKYGMVAGTGVEVSMSASDGYNQAFDAIYAGLKAQGIPQATAYEIAASEAETAIPIGAAGGLISALGVPRSAAKVMAGVGLESAFDVAKATAASAVAEGVGEGITNVGSNVAQLGIVEGVTLFSGTGEAVATGAVVGGTLTAGLETAGAFTNGREPVAEVSDTDLREAVSELVQFGADDTVIDDQEQGVTDGETDAEELIVDTGEREPVGDTSPSGDVSSGGQTDTESVSSGDPTGRFEAGSETGTATAQPIQSEQPQQTASQPQTTQPSANVKEPTTTAAGQSGSVTPVGTAGSERGTEPAPQTAGSTGITSNTQGSDQSVIQFADGDPDYWVNVLAEIARGKNVDQIYDSNVGNYQVRFGDAPAFLSAGKKFTSAEQAVGVIAQHLQTRLDETGFIIPSDLAEMTRDQFVVAYEFNNAVPQFEGFTSDFGTVINATPTGFTVDPDALFDKYHRERESLVTSMDDVFVGDTVYHGDGRRFAVRELGGRKVLLEVDDLGRTKTAQAYTTGENMFYDIPEKTFFTASPTQATHTVTTPDGQQHDVVGTKLINKETGAQQSASGTSIAPSARTEQDAQAATSPVRSEPLPSPTAQVQNTVNAQLPEIQTPEIPDTVIQVNGWDTAPTTTGEVLNTLMPMIDNDQFRYLHDAAKAVMPFVKDVKMRFSGLGFNVDGVFDVYNDTITITVPDAHTIIHEAVHAATAHALTEVSTNKTANIRGLLQSYYDETLRLFKDNDIKAYGLTNIHEFVAEVFTNRTFREKLDSLILDSDRTMMDKVRDGLLTAMGVPKHYSADAAVELSALLFETSRDIIDHGLSPYSAESNLSGNWDDWKSRVDGKGDVRPGLTRRATSLNSIKTLTWWRKMFVDRKARFLDYLNRDARLGTFGRAYDDISLHKQLQNASGKTTAALGHWQRTQLRHVIAANKAMHKKYKHLGYNNDQITEHFAAYATAAHIPTATNVVEIQLLSELATADKDLKTAKSAGFGNEVIEPLQDKLDAITTQVAEFRRVQDTNIVTADTDQSFIQGGMTRKQAQQFMAEFVSERGYDQDDLDAMQKMYVDAFAALREFGLLHGEYTQEDIAQWDALGLADDYIAFTGLTEKIGLDGSPVGSGREVILGGGSLSPSLVRGRKGRVSAPDTALVALHKRAEQLMIAYGSREFRENLAAHVRRKLLPGARIANTKQPLQIPDHGSFIRVRAPNGGHDVIWFDKQYTDVMDAIKGVHDEVNHVVSSMMENVTRSFASLVTRWTAMFPLVNWLRDTPERLANLLLRDIKKADGTDLDKARFTSAMLTNAASPAMFAQITRVLVDRNRGKVGDAENQTYWGKRMRELEEQGGLTTMLADFKPTDDDLMAKVVGARNGKDLRSFLRTTKLTRQQITGMVNLWNDLFDMRASLAAYDALRVQGVSALDASFRVRDVMNFNQRGLVTPYLAAFFPFANPTLQSAANLTRSLRKSMTKEGIAVNTSLFMFSMAAYGIAMMFSGEDENDPFLGNKVHNTHPASLAGNVPMYTADGERFNIPVGYGLPRIMWAGATLTWRKVDARNADDVDVMGGVLNATMKEMSPLHSQINFGSDPIGWTWDAVTPMVMKPLVMAWANKNFYGGNVDNFVDNSKPRAVQGRAKTEESVKEFAQIMRANHGLDYTPQQWKGILQGYMIGPLSGMYQALFADPAADVGGKRVSKGRELSSRQELGYFDVLGLSRLYGKTTNPEAGMYYYHLQKLEERLREQAYDPVKKTYVIDDVDLAVDYERRERYAKEFKQLGREFNAAYKDAVQTGARTSTDPERQEIAISRQLMLTEPEFVAIELQRKQLMRDYLKEVYRD